VYAARWFIFDIPGLKAKNQYTYIPQIQWHRGLISTAKRSLKKSIQEKKEWFPYIYRRNQKEEM
jgi:hypothetical protein